MQNGRRYGCLQADYTVYQREGAHMPVKEASTAACLCAVTILLALQTREGARAAPADKAPASGAASAPAGEANRPAAASKPAKVSFFGVEANASAIVYLTDRNASMMDNWERVRKEMTASIEVLAENQSFDILLFTEGQPMEMAGRKLLPADETNKKAAKEFVGEAQARGQTDPLPALKRAFEILNGAEAGREKALFLLTDSDFPDNQAVVDLCRRLNAKKDVRICTVLYAGAERPSKKAEEAMKKIASQSGGTYNCPQDK
jgi:hypothetical protein